MKTKKVKSINQIHKLIDLINSEKVMLSAGEINRELFKIAKTVRKERNKKNKRIKELNKVIRSPNF